MDDSEGSPPTLNADIETEVKELLGLFDLPAFARRGQDLEIDPQAPARALPAVAPGMLDMVHLRLRQWSRAVNGPDGLVRGLHALDRATVAAFAMPKNRRGPTHSLPFAAGD